MKSLRIDKPADPTLLKKGIYLVLLHATRVPPHIGILTDNAYHSLTIKGRELNINKNVLLKNITLRKIPAVFIRLKKHPVFSKDHLNETFTEQLKTFEKVDGRGITCLSPIRLFFEELYAIPSEGIQLLPDLLQKLEENEFIEQTFGANLGKLNGNIFYLPSYNREELDKQIESELKKLKS